jgi:hypothetical protein
MLPTVFGKSIVPKYVLHCLRFTTNETKVARAWEWEHHFPKNLGSIYIYIYYNAFIFKRNLQKAKLVAECMKTCIFVLLVDEYYIIMKLEMTPVVH